MEHLESPRYILATAEPHATMSRSLTFLHTDLHSQSSAHRARLGFVVSAGDQTFSDDLRAVHAPSVELSFAVVDAAAGCGASTRDNPARALRQIQLAASSLQGDDELDVALFARGSPCALIGNRLILQALQQGAPRAQVSTICTATRRALRAIGVGRLVVATSYDAATNQRVREALGADGLRTIAITGLDLGREAASRLDTRELRAFVLSLDRADADAILISSTSLRAMSIVEELEQLAGKPVLCSNQIAIWDALRCTGVSDKIPGYGSLLGAY